MGWGRGRLCEEYRQLAPEGLSIYDFLDNMRSEWLRYPRQ